MTSKDLETIVLVPNFNGLAHLPECLSSLQAQNYRQFKIVVVDDCSTDTSRDYLKTDWPNIDIFALQKNMGFAKAVNNGLNYARAKYQPKYLAILNNDTKVDPDWLRNLILAFDQDPKIVAVASNMFFYDRPNIINSQGGKFTFNGYGLDINFNQKKSEIIDQPRLVLASCWGATMIKSGAFDLIGLLDENYYAYFEDLDWGYRANLLGYKIIFEPTAIVYHKGSAFWTNYPFQKTYLCRRNSLYTILKNYELKNILKVIPIVVVNNFLLYPIGYLLNRKIERRRLVPIFKKEEPWTKRLKFLTIPLTAFYWNLKNLTSTLRLRNKIQSTRKINDAEIFKLSSSL